MPRSFASCTSWCAHSRTCPTEPGAEPSSGSCTVWMESTTSTSGFTSSTAAITDGSDVSDTSHNRPSSVPRRSARKRTCWRLSSADTSRQRSPPAERAERTCSSSVDFPMPGSPPSSVTEPGTSPPSSTRSSSDTPVGRGAHSAASTSRIGTARSDVAVVFVAARGGS